MTGLFGTEELTLSRSWFAARISALVSKRKVFTTGSLYLVPKLMPLALVILLTLRSGLGGLGEAALALSLWQFLLVVSDFGVSQWLLTKRVVNRKEALIGLAGRASVGLVAAVVVGVLAASGVLDLGPSIGLGLCVALALSFGQMAFAWELQRGRRRRAFLYVVIEFLLPVLALFFFESAELALVAVIITKTLMGLLLTAVSLAGVRSTLVSEGLPPQSFGIHSSAWALTSVASGTGELTLLSNAGSVLFAGAYRIFQTIASVGSTVGFAALAPLMSREMRSVTRIGRPMLLLGSVSAVLLAIGVVPGLLLTGGSLDGHELWALFACASLAATAVLNSMAIVPLSAVARDKGSKYTFRIGLFSASTYWAIIVVLGLIDAPLLAPAAALVAGVVGFLGNLLVWRTVTEPDHGGSTLDASE